MKTFRFTYHHGRYHCSEPGDQGGEYVPAATSAGLVAALEQVLPVLRSQPAPTWGDWNWPQLVEVVESALASARGQ